LIVTGIVTDRGIVTAKRSSLKRQGVNNWTNKLYKIVRGWLVLYSTQLLYFFNHTQTLNGTKYIAPNSLMSKTGWFTSKTEKKKTNVVFPADFQAPKYVTHKF